MLNNIYGKRIIKVNKMYNQIDFDNWLYRYRDGKMCYFSFPDNVW